MSRRASPLAACLLIGACGGGEPAPPPVAAEGSTEIPRELLAVGYAELDEEADDGVEGVTRWDRGRAWPGVNLYADDADRCLAVGMAGELLHEWRLSGGRRCEYFELQEEGRIVVVSEQRGLFCLDRDSRLLWEVPMNAHHDVAPRPGGGFLAPDFRLDEDYRGRTVRFDGLVWISALGEVERRWWTDEHLEELQALHAPLPLDTPAEGGDVDAAKTTYDYYHLNSVEVLPASELGERDARFRAGNLLLCFRNASLLLVLDGDTLAPTWTFGPGEVDFPHMPTLVDGRHLLVYDNGFHRGWSRVIELNPISEEVVWEYRADPPQAFFSKQRGSSQRLPNGHTLICESDRGRAFEVTEDGEVVWEYWNPNVVEGKRRWIYRLLRVARGDLPWLE